MAHVFVSYLREDGALVDRLANELRDRGVKVWVDRDAIRPGEPWQLAIEIAVKDGAFFLACFSDRYEEKQSSFMREELHIALAQAGSRASGWLIPVRLSDCSIPDLGGQLGELLRSVQWVDLFDAWDHGVEKLGAAMRPTAIETSRRILDSIERDNRKAALRRRPKDVTLAQLESSTDDAVELVCCFGASPDWPVRIRPEVTLGELAAAISRAKYPNDLVGKHYYLCYDDRTERDSATTAEELRNHSIKRLTLYWSEPRPGPIIAMAMPRRGLDHEMKKTLAKPRHARLWVRAWFYLRLFALPWFNSLRPPAWIAYRLNELALMYAEAGIHADRAVELVRLLERSPLAKRWEYRDTMAWVWYRAGAFDKAFSLLAEGMPDEAVGDLGVMYHLYFVAAAVGDSATVETVRRLFAERFPEVDWSNQKPLRGPDGMRAELFWHELECRRVLNRDSALMLDGWDATRN